MNLKNIFDSLSNSCVYFKKEFILLSKFAIFFILYEKFVMNPIKKIILIFYNKVYMIIIHFGFPLIF